MTKEAKSNISILSSWPFIEVKVIVKQVRNPKDLKRVNTKSPRFIRARERLEITPEEIKIKSKKDFEYNEKGELVVTQIGNEVDPEVASVKYQNHLRALMQTYNLVLELRLKTINKELRVKEFYGDGKCNLTLY